MHVEEPPDPQSLVGGTFAERGEHQVLPDADLVLGVDQSVLLHHAYSTQVEGENLREACLGPWLCELVASRKENGKRQNKLPKQ